ncbi:MAG: FkbM family methyltransferase [Acidobacteria bacterium]|nr:FkbM family methyltransferase [Acidobacteriota bacterium]
MNAVESEGDQFTTIEVPVVQGEAITFHCENNLNSRWVSRDILMGRTYPILPFVTDVSVIADIGANCGATTVLLAHHYPEATIHAVEPGSRQRSLIERNVASLPRVVVHPIGLSDADREMRLYRGIENSGTSSIVQSAHTSNESEIVQIRSASRWANENAIDHIDILKVDVEGCETAVLNSLSKLLETVKVLYVEYDGRVARLEIDALLAPTHELYVGSMFLDQGECVYISKALADETAATDHLRSQFAGLQDENRHAR